MVHKRSRLTVWAALPCSGMVCMSQHSEEGARYRKARILFLAANPICWICGHMGADTIDHKIPRSVRKTKMDIANWAPAHGIRGCPHCVPHPDGRPRRCNQERGIKPIEHVAKKFVPAIDW